MSVLIGILLDVSGSMRENIGNHTHRADGISARSIFSTIDELIKQDVSPDNKVFAIGFGAECKKETFDLLGTIKQFQNIQYDANPTKGVKEIIDEILSILERNGAGYVRNWVSIDLLETHVPREFATVILDKLKNDSSFARKIVRDCLPDVCRRESISDAGLHGAAVDFLHKNALSMSASILKSTANIDVTAKDADVIEVMYRIKEVMLIDIGEQSVISIHEARDILHGYIDENNLTEEQKELLLKKVNPFIYGRTPLIEALNKAALLFSDPCYGTMKKLLFVLSDGDPTDHGTVPKDLLMALNVITISCFITTKSSIDNPRKLYCFEDGAWSESARFMFNLSSTISTQSLPRTIFVKRGWTIDIANNETKLFFQVNHPDIISEVCDLAKSVVFSQDALVDVLGSVSLDLYINEANDVSRAKWQVGGTCYANAAATVMHLAMKRIIGRDGGYPNFFKLRQELISLYGKRGANTFLVLQEMCPRYRLNCKVVDTIDAMQAVAAKRPVLAKFRLTDDEWRTFSNFYEINRQGVLTRNEIDISRRPPSCELGGHAVVLVSYDSTGFRFMNSWGSNWADNGFFKVSDVAVLNFEFIDVFWTLNDLKSSEIQHYDLYGREQAAKLVETLTGLQTAQFKCPLCLEYSLVSGFSGSIFQVECPKCDGTFSTRNSGGSMGLSLYLTALT